MEEIELGALRGVVDPLERARRAHQILEELDANRHEFLLVRDGAIQDMYRDGRKQAAIARDVGLSRSLVNGIVRPGPGAERGFWAADKGRITVAVGRKMEAPKASGEPGPTVAVEDYAAFDMLRNAAADVRVDAVLEVISPDGNVDLNRAGLVVVCGPRLSPIIGQMLAADCALAFASDDTGHWYLRDRKAGRAYRSPMDEGEDSDIAYLGRLPRPDGRGTFVYMAGIHAPGEAGAAHYLADELEEVWQAVRDSRFSALVRCTFDPDTRTVISSERITDFYTGER